jgi:hypothetical protein
MEYPYFFRMKL